jgi:hypothetical protein
VTDPPAGDRRTAAKRSSTRATKAPARRSRAKPAALDGAALLAGAGLAPDA